MPHEGIKGDYTLVFDAFEGDNLMDMALADPLLQTYIECACGGKMACSVSPATVSLLPSSQPVPFLRQLSEVSLRTDRRRATSFCRRNISHR